MTIRKLEVTLETVTPLFLGGADGKSELRPPPFRGLMRYWFRALVGGVVSDTNEALKQIKQKEAEVFGSPDEKHGQSAVWVRLNELNFKKGEAKILPHRDDPWINHQGRRMRNEPKPVIPPGTTTNLILTLKPGESPDKLEMAVWSLLVGLTLGGIGKRSRRGFGGLCVK